MKIFQCAPGICPILPKYSAKSVVPFTKKWEHLLSAKTFEFIHNSAD